MNIGQILKTLLVQLYNFVSNNFDLLIAMNVAFLVMLILLISILRLSEVAFWGNFKRFLRGIMFFIIVSGQVFWLLLCVYIYWINYEKPIALIKFPQQVMGETFWVKDNTPIFFINGKTLGSVHPNGKNKRILFQAEESIREFVFSPDGKSLLITTMNGLYHLNIESKSASLIDRIASKGDFEKMKEEELKGVISNVRWAPDNNHFCYEISKWSRFARQDYIYVYDLSRKLKRLVKNPVRKMSSLRWDLDGQNLYYLNQEAKNPIESAYPYEVTVVKVPLRTLLPEIVTTIPTDKKDLPLENLDLRGIELYLGSDRLTFGKYILKENLISPRGKTLGIDEDDFLYYKHHRWFKKRLLKIPRMPIEANVAFHQYKGGERTIRDIRWLPNGRYVLLRHQVLGPFILEPSSGKMGYFFALPGEVYGWYTKQ